jgi:diguanylate cyclase (GGDEF)-like protein
MENSIYNIYKLYRILNGDYMDKEKEYLKKIKTLEKENNILKKRLERSELSRVLLEQAKDHYDLVYRSNIEKLNEQKLLLDIKNQELDKIHQELIIKNKELIEASTIDWLTRLYNRKKTNEILINDFYRTNSCGMPLAVAMLDIDYFKNINDNFGHQVGDYVLIELAKIMTSHLRDSDSVGRWGGEEFLGILPFTSALNAFEYAEALRLHINEHKFYNIPKVTVSIGITESLTGDDIDDLLKKVDTALYKAKRLRNCTCIC